MPCSSVIDVSCLVGSAVSGAASSAGHGVMSGLAGAVQSGLGWIVKNSLTFWLSGNSPYLTGQAAALGRMHHWLLPVTGAVAVGGAIAAGARMTLTRKHAPLLDVTGGLAVMGLAAALGMLVPTVVMKAGDLWTAWILNVSSGGNFNGRITLLLTSGFSNSTSPAVVIIVFGFIAMVTSGIQTILLLFRDAGILVLAAVLPLAAAGAIAPATRTWIKKITAWMLALVCYKPAAAAVYATAFTMTGSGNGLRAILTGVAMLVLSLFALPVLMKFFTWTTGTVGSSGGGTGQLFGMAASGALAFGAMRGGASSSSAGGPAIQQADDLRTNGPSPAGPGPSGGTGGTGTPGPSGTPGSPGASGSPGSSGPEGTSSPGAPARPGPAPSPATSPAPRESGSAPHGTEAAQDGSGRGPDTAPGARPSGSGAGPPAGSGNTSSGVGTTSFGTGAQAAGRGAGTATEAGAAGPIGAALFAAQALAAGAKNATASSMEEGDQS